MVTVPLIVLLFGDVFQLPRQRIFVCMISQFLMILLGYLAALSNGLCLMLLFFLLSSVLFVIGIVFFCNSCSHFISRLQIQGDKVLKGFFVSLVIIWTLYPITFILHGAGLLDNKDYLIFGLFLDVVAKLCALGLCFLLYYHFNENKQKHGIGIMLKQNKTQALFLRFIYHELRNPFNTLMLGIDHLKDELQDANCKVILSTIKKSASAMNQVINAAADLSENQGTLELVVQPTDLRSLLDSVLQAFSSKATDKAIFIQTHISDENLEEVLVDQPKLMNIYKCLVSNAVKFTNPFTTVDIFLQVEHTSAKKSKIVFLCERLWAWYSR